MYCWRAQPNSTSELPSNTTHSSCLSVVSSVASMLRILAAAAAAVLLLP